MQLTENGLVLIKVGGKVQEIKKKDIPSFITPYFQKWLDCWWWFHEKGMLPLNKSWYEHPRHVTRTLRAMESAYNRYQAEKREQE